MKSIPNDLVEHYESGATSTAYCLKVVRQDGATYGWTSCSVPLTVDGVLYETGFDVTDFVQASGLAVNNLELTIVPDEEGGTITRADLLVGRWDNAAVEFFEINYRAQ